MDDRQNKTGRKMIGNMFKHNFMIRKGICVTFGRLKRGFSGSDQMPLNTLGSARVEGAGVAATKFMRRAELPSMGMGAEFL